jgi:hypothetical protein
MVPLKQQAMGGVGGTGARMAGSEDVRDEEQCMTEVVPIYHRNNV